jgi:hypothetical protein
LGKTKSFLKVSAYSRFFINQNGGRIYTTRIIHKLEYIELGLLFVRISVDYFPFSVSVPDMAFCTGFVAIDTLADFSDGTLALRAGFWLDFTVIRVLVSDFCSAEFLGFLSFGKGLVDVVTTGVGRCGVFVSGYLASLLTHLCIGYSL